MLFPIFLNNGLAYSSTYHVVKLSFQCLLNESLLPALLAIRYSHFHLVAEKLTAKVLLQVKKQVKKVTQCKARAVRPMINDVPSKEVNHVRGSGSSVWSGVIERLDSICQHTTAFVQDRLSELFLVFQQYRFMACPSGINSKSFGVTVFVWL